MILLEILDKEPVHFIDEINWKGIPEKWPYELDPQIDGSALKEKFFRLVQYRVPFYSHLSYSDIIELLMEHFCKPQRDKSKKKFEMMSESFKVEVVD